MTVERFSTPPDLGGLPKLTDLEVAQREAANALRQFDRVIELVRQTLSSGNRFVLRPEVIKELNRIALDGLDPEAGDYREGPMEIEGSRHQPPAACDVSDFVDGMCEHFNGRAGIDDPIDLSAYLMWRVNWIHPFMNGNGRTSRAVSYLALSVGLGAELPGVPTVPDRIASNKAPYYAALDAADAANLDGRVDVSVMAQLIRKCLTTQLASIVPPKP